MKKINKFIRTATAIFMICTMIPTYSMSALADDTAALAEAVIETASELPQDVMESEEIAEVTKESEAASETTEDADTEAVTEPSSAEPESESISESEASLETTAAMEEEAESEEVLTGADVISSQGLYAVTLQGHAAESASAAKEVLGEESTLSLSEIRDITADLLPDYMSLMEEEALAEDDPEFPRQADGSNIEGISAKWITADTVDNGSDSLLYIRPDSDELQEVRLQVNYALSGEHNYEPGDVTITVPVHIFTNRSGSTAGNIIVPFPEEPSTRGDFNWKLVGDNYILTNTKRMSAATKGYIQFAFTDLRPHEIVDLQESAPFDAYIQVVTHKGNTIALRSNELTAQIDTEARIISTSKRVYGSPARVDASQIPESQRIEGEEEYIKVDWYVWGSLAANTMYTLDIADTMPDEYDGFMINATSEDGLERNVTNAATGYRDDQTSYYYYSTAYPASRFEPDTNYTFHNNVKMVVTEVDPEAEVANPNVQEADPQLVTEESASAQTNWSYTLPQWIDPTGHFMVTKNGNDDKTQNGVDKYNYTHKLYYGSAGYSDLHLWSWSPNGWYGIYPSAINELQDNYAAYGQDGYVRISYTIDTVGYVMPWMFNTASYATDGTVATRRSINYSRPVTMITTDTGVSIGRYGEKLTIGTDYDLVSVEFPDSPWVYYGAPQNINPDGSFTALSAGDGTFRYTRLYDKSLWPDIELQIMRNGKWEPYATASWKSGDFTATLTDGSVLSSRVIDVPAGTENFRTVVTLQNTSADLQQNIALQAALDYDVRAVINLKSTDALMELIDQAFENSNTPEMFVYNGANMTAERADVSADDSDREIVSIDKDGYDSIRGYTTDTMVYPYKSASQSIRDVDYDSRTVIIHYSARVEERSIINDKVTYEQAIADGRLIAETHGIWRDLLPKGVVPQLSSVKLRGGDTITDIYTVENYNNSGRTLMIVEADLTPAAVRYRSGDMYYYEDVPSISFDAVYDFDCLIDYGDRVHNVIAFESNNDHIGTVKNYTGEPDDPYSSNNISTARAFENAAEKDLMKDLDPKRDDPSFVYAGAYTTIDIISAARTSLSKDIMTNNDGYWSDGLYYGHPELNKRTVYEGGVYTYRLRMMSDDNTISRDLVLYDSLENFYAGEGNDDIDIDAARWQGQLINVDTSQLVTMGCAPVVYYSTVSSLELSDESSPGEANAANIDVANRKIWIPAAEYAGSLADVKAIAIDAGKKADGSDFELEPLESAVVLINMRAPSGEAAAAYIEQDAHAYNNAYMVCTSIDKKTLEADSDRFVRKDYTKVGLEEYRYTATKIWNDANNRDGKRPETVTFTLYADGVSTGRSVTLPIIDEETGEESWVAKFHHIPYTDADGNKIRYFVQEENVPEYKASTSGRTETQVTYTNRHTPEKISVSGMKLWEGDTEYDRPEYINVYLYKNGTYFRTKRVTPDDDGVWSYSFDDLFKYEDGTEIEYTVKEEQVTSGAGASYITSTEQTEDGWVITNTYHPKGDLIVSKLTQDTTSVSAQQLFEFTFEFSRRLTNKETGEDEVVPVFDEYEYEITEPGEEEPAVISTGKISNNGTIKIKGGQQVHIKEIDEYVIYAVTEAEAAGFTLTGSSEARGIIQPNDTRQASFTNTYHASGQINLQAEKKLLNRELQRYQFRFELYQVTKDDRGEAVETLLRSAANAVPANVTAQQDEEGNDIEGTVASSAAPVTFGALRYTQDDANIQAQTGLPYTYKLVETDTGKDGYTYSTDVYYADVTVTDNGDGTLHIVPEYYRLNNGEKETVRNAEFTNEYKAEGGIVLRAWKDLQGRSLQDEEFTFELYGEELDESGKNVLLQTKTNSADGSIVFDAISYNETDIGKTYYYFVKEVTGSDDTVNYDPYVFGYSVTIVDSGDGTLIPVQGFESVEKEDDHYTVSGESTDIPVFANTLKPGSLSISKYTRDAEAADPAQEFHFKVRLIGDLEGSDLEYTLSEVSQDTAGGSFGGQSGSATREAIVNRPRLVSAPAADDIAGGTYEGVSWRITAAGELVLGNGSEQTFTYNSGRGYSSYPWYSYRTSINSISFDGTVCGNGDMGLMFRDCSNVTSINAAGFDTTLVTCMNGMFWGCSSLTSLNLSGFNTSKVTKMHNMFQDCRSLTSLNISSFSTPLVNRMDSMFDGCSSLAGLDVSSLDTSSVTNMCYMFYGCSSLRSLDLSSFNTEKVTDMGQMLQNCSSLRYLNLSSISSSGARMGNFLSGCSALQQVNLGSRFSFAGTSANKAALPAPPTTGNYNGKWVRADNAYGPYTPAELASAWSSNASDMAGTWIWDGSDLIVIEKGRIHYDANGGRTTAPDEIIDFESEFTSVRLPEPDSTTRDGYDLESWNTRRDGTGNSYTPGEEADDIAAPGTTVTLYAQWGDPDKCRITFIADDGIGGSMAPVRFDSQQDVTLPVSRFAKFGYEFDYWSVESVNNTAPAEAVTYQESATISAGTYQIGDRIVLKAHMKPVGISIDLEKGEFEIVLHGGEKAAIDNLPAGTAYQVWEETPDGWILIEQSNVSGNIEPLETADVRFTNKYQPGSTTAQFSGTKTLDGRAAEAGAYSFTLSENDQILQTVQTQSGGFIQFDVIVYEADDVGTHVYTIRETDPEDSTIDYDTHVENVTVVVTDDGHGNLSSEVIYDEDGIRFANTTRPGILRITKNAENVTDANRDDEFTFKITLNSPNGIPMGSDNSVYWYIEDRLTGGGGAISTEQTSVSTLSRLQKLNKKRISAISSAEDGIDENGHFHATADMLQGTAYAVVTDDNELIFFRSNRQYTNQTTGNAVDILGNTYHGLICTGFENSGEWIADQGRTLPWASRREVITSVRVAQGQAIKPKNMNNWFMSFKSAAQFDLNRIDTSQVTTMGQLFGFCYAVTELDLSTFDTSKVSGMYDMACMFFYANELRSVNMSGLDLSQVYSMRRMFEGCEKLTNINLEGSKTGMCNKMNSMFLNCKALKELDLRVLNTSRVTEMQRMFSGCQNLEKLDISSFNTGRCNDMSEMFSYDNSLKEVCLGSDFQFKTAVLPSARSVDIYTGYWIRDDKIYGPYSASELAAGYSAEKSGTWIWEIDESRGIVRFDANGGYTSASQIIATSADQSITMPGEQTTRPHYVLIGWNAKADGSGRGFEPDETVNDIVVLGSYTTLYAQWTESDLREYKVKHYQQNISLDGYNLYEVETFMADKGTTVIPEPKTYSYFISPEPKSKEVLDDDSLVIEYYYDREVYEIAFDGNGATSGQMNESLKMVRGISRGLSANIYQKTGSIFTGWNTAADGSGTSYTDRQQVADLAGESGGVITLYAQWLSNEDGELNPESGVIYVSCKAGETIVIPGLPAGTAYTIEEVDLPNGWSMAGTVNENGTIAANQTASSSVNNRYTADGSIYLTAHKMLKGKDAEEGQFTFELLDAGFSVIQTKTNGTADTSDTISDDEGNAAENPWKGTALVEFDALNFTAPGTYTYYIREVKGSDENVTYDEHLETVTVNVTDLGGGLLEAEASYDEDGTLFTNSMNPTDLKISKTTVGATGAADDEEFAFLLELTDPSGNALTDTFAAKKHTRDYHYENTKETVTRYAHTPNINDDGISSRNYDDNMADRQVVTIPGAQSLHIELTYNIENSWDFLYVFNYNYTDSIYRNMPEAWRTYSNYNSTPFTTSFDVEGDTVTFCFVSDGSVNYYGYYAVITAEADREVETGYEDLTVRAGDTITLKGGEYIEVYDIPHGTSYKVTEQLTEVQAQNWKMTDSSDTEGTLQAGKVSEAKFENTCDKPDNPPEPEYSADGKVQFAAYKTMEGGSIDAEDGFTFTLTDEDGNVIQTKTTDLVSDDDIKVTESPVTFDEIAYTGADAGKTFVYLIRESAGSDENVVYDSRSYEARVEVADNGDGTLSTVTSYFLLGEDEEHDVQVDRADFVNRKYGSIQITKKLENKEQMNGRSDPATFVFSVEGWYKGERVYSDVISMVFTESGSQSRRIEGLPVGTVVTVAEVYSGGNYVLKAGFEPVVTREIITDIAETPAIEMVFADFTNTYNDTWKGGGSITNHIGSSGERLSADEAQE